MSRQELQPKSLFADVVATLRLFATQAYATLSRHEAGLAAQSRASATRALLLALFLILVNLASSAYFLVGQRQVLGGTYFLIDDAWIHSRFAKNLAEGYGFSFNPGHPIAASTAPLWTLIQAASYRLTGQLVLSTYFWGIVLFATACFLVYRLTLLLSDNFYLAATSATLASLCPWLTWSALSGMEIMLSATLILTTLFLHLKYQDDQNWQSWLGAATAGLATLARPEAYVLFLAMVIHRLFRVLLTARQSVRYSVTVWLPLSALLFTLIVVPYGLFSLNTAGSFFPNTYAAKVGDLGLLGAIQSGSLYAITRALFIHPWLYLRDFVESLAMINPILVVALPLGMLGLLRRNTFLLPLFVLLFPLLVGMVVPTDRVSWPWYRHMLNLAPVFVIVSLVGNQSLLSRLLAKAPSWALPLRKLLIGLLVISIGLPFLITQPRVRAAFVARGAKMKTEHIAIARWIDQHLPPEAIIAASDIGVVGFYTQNFILDTEGLITPEILGEHRRNGRAKDKEVYQYLAETKPDYLVKFRNVYATFSDTEFIPIYSSGKLVVYRTPWTRDWPLAGSPSENEPSWGP